MKSIQHHLRNFGLAAGLLALVLTAAAQPAEVYNVYNSGSTGADGEFNPTLNPGGTVTGAPPGTTWSRVSSSITNLTVPLGASGIFHFTRVTVPAWAYVNFIPNANNTPVVWLSQSNIVLNGVVSVSAPDTQAAIGATATRDIPGPGGYFGGGPGMPGQGPAGGVGTNSSGFPKSGGNGYVSLPLVGGSGGCGKTVVAGGGGGVLYLVSSMSISAGIGGRVEVEGATPNSSTANAGSGGNGVAAFVANQVSGCRVVAGNLYNDALGLIVAFQGGSAGLKTIFPPSPVGILSGPAPVARVASIGTFTIADAAANATVPFVARIPAGGLQTVTLETRNLPVGISFQVRFTQGTVTTTNTFAPTVGTTALATSSGTFDFGGGTTLVSAVATQPVQVALAPAFRSERLRELQIACDSEGRVTRQFVTDAGAAMSFDAAMRLALVQGKWAFLLRGGS